MEPGASRQVLADALAWDAQVQAVGPEDDLAAIAGHVTPDVLLFASPTGGQLGLLRSLRAAYPSLAIVVLALGSTLSSEGFLERLGELAITRYVQLPIDPEELRRRIRAYFASRRDVSHGPESFKRFFRKDEVIFLENDLGAECFIVNAGGVEISKALNRYTLRPLAQVGAGEIFGEMALLATGRRSATAIAREATIATVLTRDNFTEVMRANPAFALELLDVFVRRHAAARERLDPSASQLGRENWFHEEACHFASRPGPRPELPERTFAPGETLLVPGGLLRTLFWITRGQVRLEPLATGGLDAAPALVTGPDVPVGEVAFLTGETVDLSATAHTETTAVLIPRERFVAAVASRPEVCLPLVQSLAARVRSFNEALGVREVLELA